MVSDAAKCSDDLEGKNLTDWTRGEVVQSFDRDPRESKEHRNNKHKIPYDLGACSTFAEDMYQHFEKSTTAHKGQYTTLKKSKERRTTRSARDDWGEHGGSFCYHHFVLPLVPMHNYARSSPYCKPVRRTFHKQETTPDISQHQSPMALPDTQCLVNHSVGMLQ
jgi:hypothetical protein